MSTIADQIKAAKASMAQWPKWLIPEYAMTKLPDCMMPDGADPCVGYQQTDARLRRAIEALEAIQRCYADNTRARVCDTDIAWYAAEGLRTARDGEPTVRLSSRDSEASR